MEVHFKVHCVFSLLPVYIKAKRLEWRMTSRYDTHGGPDWPPTLVGGGAGRPTSHVLLPAGPGLIGPHQAGWRDPT